MEIEITEEVENPMLHRTDVTFELSHDEATPSRLSVRDSLAARLNKSADEVVIRRLDTKFGMRKTIGTAKVYETPDDAREIEQDHMLERNKIGAAENGESADGDSAEPAATDEIEEEPAESDAAVEVDEVDEEPADEGDAADGDDAEAEAETEAEAASEAASEADAEAEAEDEPEPEAE